MWHYAHSDNHTRKNDEETILLKECCCLFPQLNFCNQKKNKDIVATNFVILKGCNFYTIFFMKNTSYYKCLLKESQES